MAERSPSFATPFMLIDCPGCARAYHVSDADLGRRGRTVMCPRCDCRWFIDAGVTGGGASPRDLEAAGVSTRPNPTLDEVPAAPRRRLPLRHIGGAVAALVPCAAATGAVAGRESVVRAVPRSAALYAAAGLPVNVTGLAFSAVVPERLASNDVTIRGTIRNVSGRRTKVPRVAFEVRDGAGLPLVTWSETVPAKVLAADREIAFVSTPHRLPGDSRSVLVRFD